MTQSPLTPPDSDLQDFAFMPLHVARLRDSDLAAEESPEACWYAVLLWAAAWHQVPAGSLPDNDAVLMRLVGLGRDARTWKKHRDGALRGFIHCDDNRLYHPVVAEQVLKSWQGKLEQRHRTECARLKKANQRNGTDIPSPDFVTFMSERHPLSVPFLSLGTTQDVPGETASKGERQREGEGEGDSITEAKASGGEPPAPDSDKAFWDQAKGYLGKTKASKIGRWVSDHGKDETAKALTAAQVERAVDPIAFIEGYFRKRKSNGYGPSHSGIPL